MGGTASTLSRVLNGALNFPEMVRKDYATFKPPPGRRVVVPCMRVSIQAKTIKSNYWYDFEVLLRYMIR